MITPGWDIWIRIFFIMLSSSVTAALGTEMVILGGQVRTMDKLNPIAQAVAVAGDRIIAVGTDEEISELITPSAAVIYADGRLVLPGFNDAHLHFVGGGSALAELDLTGVAEPAAIRDRIRLAAENTPPGEWIIGRGWDHTLFNAGRWPNKSLLDQAAPRRPVFLTRVDGHVAWVNSAALALADITHDTPDPVGGAIVRASDGQPTGVLLESAVDLVQRLIPQNSENQNLAAVRRALMHARELGITSVQDNSGIESCSLYRRLAENGELTVRVSEWLDLSTAQEPSKLAATMAELRMQAIPHLLRPGLLKGFVDGTLGSRTAALFEPYVDDPSTCGLPKFTLETLVPLLTAADSLGLQVGLHCIGDKAAWTALTAYSAASCGDVHSKRHRIEHAQVLRAQDLAKLSEFGVIASMQPTHCTSDLRWAEERLGHERSRGAYAWRSILASGGMIAFGTDWPIEPLDPMRGIYSAVTRRNIETGLPPEGWFPEQCLSVEEAVYCYTMGSAFAEFAEQDKGSISPGKLADIIILDRNIFEIAPEEILKTRVDLTILGGRVVYTRPQ